MSSLSLDQNAEIFLELASKDRDLQDNVALLQDEVVKLSSLNGQGDGVRRKIRRSLLRFMRGEYGESR
jgi:hypothetical protein